MDQIDTTFKAKIRQAIGDDYMLPRAGDVVARIDTLRASCDLIIYPDLEMEQREALLAAGLYVLQIGIIFVYDPDPCVADEEVITVISSEPLAAVGEHEMDGPSAERWELMDINPQPTWSVLDLNRFAEVRESLGHKAVPRFVDLRMVCDDAEPPVTMAEYLRAQRSAFGRAGDYWDERATSVLPLPDGRLRHRTRLVEVVVLPLPEGGLAASGRGPVDDLEGVDLWLEIAREERKVEALVAYGRLRDALLRAVPDVDNAPGDGGRALGAAIWAAKLREVANGEEDFGADDVYSVFGPETAQALRGAVNAIVAVLGDEPVQTVEDPNVNHAISVDEMSPEEIRGQAVALADYVNAVMNLPNQAPLPAGFLPQVARLADLALEMADHD